MKCVTSRLCFVALCLGLLVSADAHAKKGGTDRPFSGSAFGSLTSAPADPDAPGPFVFDYVLQATHMGKGTRTETAFFGENNTLFGDQIWTAANGDQIFVDFDATITSETTAEGLYTFVGGTGRFEDASGQADFIAIFPDFSDVSIFFDGTLSYSGNNPNAVPEPSSLTLLGLAGLLGLTLRRRARG